MVALGRAPLLAAVTVAAAAASTLGPKPPARTVSAQAEGMAANRTAQILEGVRGTSPLACEMILRSLGIGWGWGTLHYEPDAVREHRNLADWASRRPSDPAMVVPLRAAMEDPDECVQRVAARLLGRTRDPSAVESLVDALADANARTRLLAAVGLGYAEDPESVDPLIRALRDDQPSVRAAAAWALGEIEDKRAIDPLSRLLSDDSDSGVRRAAALALGSLY